MMTPTEMDNRATTIANLAALASKIEPGAERHLIMEVAAALSNTIARPAYLMDNETGKVIQIFPGGKA